MALREFWRSGDSTVGKGKVCKRYRYALLQISVRDRLGCKVVRDGECKILQGIDARRL